MVGIGRQSAALAGLEIHHMLAARAVVKQSTTLQRQCGLAGFGQHRQIDTKAAVGALGAANGLKHQINRRTTRHGLQGIGDVGKDARLGWNGVAGNHLVEHVQKSHHLGHVVGGGVDADDGVPTAVQQPVEQAGGNACGVIRRVVGLQARGQALGQPDGAAKARNHAAFAGNQHQVLQAADFAHSGHHFGRQPRG